MLQKYGFNTTLTIPKNDDFWGITSDTPLLEEAERGEFTPLDERELMQELKTFLELLTCDCEVNTHHTSSLRVPTGPFLPRKQQILDALQDAIDHADIDTMTRRRQQKRGL